MIADVIGENVSANIGRRRKVVAAAQARIRVQIESHEIAIQIDLDVDTVRFCALSGLKSFCDCCCWRRTLLTNWLT
jgi:hypothetical protein